MYLFAQKSIIYKERYLENIDKFMSKKVKLICIVVYKASVRFFLWMFRYKGADVNV